MTPAELLLGGLTLLGLVLRLRHAACQTVISDDAAHFLRLWESVLPGIHGISFPGSDFGLWPPLYPLLTLLCAGHASPEKLEWTARLVSVVAGTLLIPLVYLLGRRLADSRAALVAAALTAVLPCLVEFSGLTYAEMLYGLLTTAALGLLLVQVSADAPPRRDWPWLAGLALGLAYLCRPEALMLLGIAVLWLALGRKREVAWGRRAGWVASCVLAFAMAATPYAVFLRQQTGHFAVSKLVFNLKLGIEPAPRPTLDASGVLHPVPPDTTTASEYLRTHRAELLAKYRANFVVLVKNVTRRLAPVPLWLLALAGLWGSAPAWPRQRALLLSWGLPALVLPLFLVTQMRLFSWIAPVVVIFAALGAVRVGEWVAARLRVEPRWGVGGVALAALVVASLPLLKDPTPPPGVPQLLKAVAQRDLHSIVMADELYYVFYGAQFHRPMPDCTPESLARHLRGEAFLSGVVIDSDLVRKVPALAPLLDPANAPRGWFVLQRASLPSGEAVVVYDPRGL